jgi:hypothetical protein
MESCRVNKALTFNLIQLIDEQTEPAGNAKNNRQLFPAIPDAYVQPAFLQKTIFSNNTKPTIPGSGVPMAIPGNLAINVSRAG